MIITIIGTGYVGLVTGTCLAETGHTVHCVDVNTEKINKLNNGIIPIYEPGLTELVLKNVKNEKLFFSTTYDSISQSDVVFIAVGTPPDEDGSADLKYVINVAEEFGKYITKRSVIVTKSTVPVGTSNIVKSTVQKVLDNRNENIEFYVCSNPEFLKEGTAIDDFMNPERIVIGCDNEYTELVMRSVYKSFEDDKILITDIPSAEMIKYAANSMLATRISFMNNIANLCSKTGANVKMVAKGIGMDSRIGPKFLNAGCGYGGSCFPKDVKALIKTGDDYNCNMEVLKAVEHVNNEQKHILYNKLYLAASKVDFQIKNITILGTAFKPDTDDMREATSVVLINDILNDNNKIGPFDEIKIWDPVALDEAKRIIGVTNEKIKYYNNLDDAILNTDVVIICTEWNEIKEMSLDVFKKLVRHNIIIDGRNCLEINDNDILYIGIGI